MSWETLRKLLRSPFSTLARGLHKTLIAPRVYRKGEGYDARRYWSDRFSKHGMSLRGAGDEGLSDAENRRVYEQGAGVFLEQLKSRGVDLASVSVLEVGVGTGYWLDLLWRSGARRYTGVDITDVLFGELRERFAGANLRRQDVTETPIDGQFELAIMMDVVEHIVEPRRLDAAMANLSAAVAPGGLAMISGLQDHCARHRFYTHAWTDRDIVSRMPGWTAEALAPFRDNRLLVLRKS